MSEQAALPFYVDFQLLGWFKTDAGNTPVVLYELQPAVLSELIKEVANDLD